MSPASNIAAKQISVRAMFKPFQLYDLLYLLPTLQVDIIVHLILYLYRGKPWVQRIAMATVKMWLSALCTDVDKWIRYRPEIGIFDLAYNRRIGGSPRTHVSMYQLPRHTEILHEIQCTKHCKNCECCPVSLLIVIVKNCQRCQKLSKVFKVFKIVLGSNVSERVSDKVTYLALLTS